MTFTAFMRLHVEELARTRDLTLVCSSKPQFPQTVWNTVAYQQIEIRRRVSLPTDLRALYGLQRLFRREKFDVVQSISPKAGLLSMIAALLAGIPIRVHVFTGQVWATRRGARRWLLRQMDVLLARCATHLLADSDSQRAFLERESVAPAGKIAVLGRGSISGVDLKRFSPDVQARAKIRAEYRIPSDAVVAVFVGRLTREKGLLELAAAFALVAAELSSLHLLLAGPDEEEMSRKILERAGAASVRVHLAGPTPRPEAYFNAGDFLVLPSHREGFGSTIIEAAACSLPSIGTRIYGLTDAIDEGISGILVETGNTEALADAIRRLTSDHAARRAMGDAARRRAESFFSDSDATRAFVEFHDRLVACNALD